MEDLCGLMWAASAPSLRGRFVDDKYTLDVAYKPPGWFRVQEQPGRLELTDGVHSVLIEGDEVTAYWADELVIHNNMRSFVRPQKFLAAGDIQRRELLDDVQLNSVLGRDAWIARVSGRDTKPALEMAIDIGTGMVLTMRHEGGFAGFETLDLGVDLADELFQWNGRLTRDERDRRGDDGTRTYSG